MLTLNRIEFTKAVAAHKTKSSYPISWLVKRHVLFGGAREKFVATERNKIKSDNSIRWKSPKGKDWESSRSLSDWLLFAGGVCLLEIVVLILVLLYAVTGSLSPPFFVFVGPWIVVACGGLLSPFSRCWSKRLVFFGIVLWPFMIVVIVSMARNGWIQ